MMIVPSAPQGWQCPCCKTVYAPSTTSCQCQRQTQPGLPGRPYTFPNAGPALPLAGQGGPIFASNSLILMANGTQIVGSGGGPAWDNANTRFIGTMDPVYNEANSCGAGAGCCGGGEAKATCNANCGEGCSC